MWACGGFPAVSNRDVDIARKKFVGKLRPREKVVADKGRRECNRFCIPKNGNPCNKRIKQILARHENANRRIKLFGNMSGIFRHDLELPHVHFYASISVVQIAIENGEKLPEVSSAYKF